MFINCRHCNALVATDPATDLPPERCPRCAGVLRLPVAAASVPPAAGRGPSHAIAPAAVPAQTVASKPPPSPEPAGGDRTDAADGSRSAAAGPPRPPRAAEAAAAHAIARTTGPAAPAPPGPVRPPAPVLAEPVEGGNAATAPGDPAGAGNAQDEAAAAPGAPPADAPSRTPPSPLIAAPDIDAAPGRQAAAGEPAVGPPQATTSDAAATTAAAPSPAFAGGGRAVNAARRPRAWAQPAAVAGLTLLLALQVVLADRDRLAADAQWRPLVGAVCGVLGCNVPPWREPEALVLLSREVRPHPDHRGALLATASFRNDAQWPQPWPQLVLTLSDVNGRAVAARAFAPDEYLGGAPGASLLSSGQTVDIALDIHEPSIETVSYAWDLRQGR